MAELEQGYLRAARLLPEQKRPLHLLAHLHGGDLERSLERLRQVVADRPEAVWARVWIVYLLRNRREPDLAGAEDALRAAAGGSPPTAADRVDVAGCGHSAPARGRGRSSRHPARS